MTINYGPQCTCGQPYWSTVPMPCPVHARTYWYVTPPRYYNPNPFTTTIYRVCQGRHCAHEAQCNKSVTWNGA
jgi:hypothetical protein